MFILIFPDINHDIVLGWNTPYMCVAQLPRTVECTNCISAEG